MPRTSAIRRKADQGEDNTHITQDVVRVIRVLPGRSFAMSIAIEAKSKAMSMYEQIRWVLRVFLAVLTSDLIASFVKGLTLQLATAAATRISHT